MSKMTEKEKEALYTDFEPDIPTPTKCIHELLSDGRRIKVFHAYSNQQYYCKDVIAGFSKHIVYGKDLLVFMNSELKDEALEVLRNWNNFLNGWADTHPCLEQNLINKVVVV
jgi:hypothetical protein